MSNDVQLNAFLQSRCSEATLHVKPCKLRDRYLSVKGLAT